MTGGPNETKAGALDRLIDGLHAEADRDRDPSQTPEIGVIMGSDSDIDVMMGATEGRDGAYDALRALGFAEQTGYDDPPDARFTFETFVVSAHRDTDHRERVGDAGGHVREVGRLPAGARDDDVQPAVCRGLGVGVHEVGRPVRGDDPGLEGVARGRVVVVRDLGEPEVGEGVVGARHDVEVAVAAHDDPDVGSFLAGSVARCLRFEPVDEVGYGGHGWVL